MHTPQQNDGSNAGDKAVNPKNTPDNFIVQPPAISLPKGGGALKNIDEKFGVNSANGTATFSIPLPVSKTRSNFAPTLSLGYNSGAGNGCFGLGWNIGLSSIQRQTDKQLPLYADADNSDAFMFTGAEDLVPMLAKNDMGNWEALEFTTPAQEKIKRYRPRIEGGFNRIERITLPGSNIFYWKVTTAANVATIYGRSPQARVADPGNATHIFKWLPELSYDDRGNSMEYEYVQDDLINVAKQLHEQHRLNKNTLSTNTYLKRVKYGNTIPYYPDVSQAYNPPGPIDPGYMFETVFDFGDHDVDNPTPDVQNTWPCRIDPISDYHAGFDIRTYRLCLRVLSFHYFKELNDNINPGPSLVNSLNLQYRYFNNPAATAKEIRNVETDYIIAIQQLGYKKKGNVYTKKRLPPVEFTFRERQWDTIVKNVSTGNTPIGIGENYQWVDLWSEGISGLLTEQANAWFYQSNAGNAIFTDANLLPVKPSLTGLANGQLQLQDIEGDGRKFIVSLSGPVKGYFEIVDNDEWKPFQPFIHLPNVDLNDPNTKLIDLNGDGRPEIIVSEENVFTWYAGRGVTGYDSAELSAKPFDEEKGPAIVFADPEQCIFLADMNGDGITDIVRIRNGDVCYWPNLGYGKFGAKVSMSYAPVFDTPDLFNPSYLHLADVGGTGTTDILYLGKNRCAAWLNLCGNMWSEPFIIDTFPNTELSNKISVIDFLGNGTACVVWSSPLPRYTDVPIRYIDLMGGIKPYMLTGYKNNMGKEVSIEYKASTFFYLQDKQAGTPWVTKLPFPVHCVSKMTVNDKTTNIYFATSYTYHHGYYDHPEKEFRGFGRVEQTDTETYENFVLSNAGNVTEQDLFQPPVKTITWYHTGAFFGQQKILNQFAHEYYKGPFEFDLPLPALPADLSAVEYREALRACKGMVLRSETYSTDGSPMQDKPYTAATHNCLIKLFQPRQEEQYAVFYVHESEAVNFYYERNVDDPRIAHTFNIEINDFGNVLQSASVVYGRKTTDASLPADIRDEQGKLHVVYTLNDITNHFDRADVYRLPLNAETRVFELTGITPGNGTAFTIDELLTAFNTAAAISYETAANNISPEKRLTEDLRAIYVSNDLVTPLALLQVDTMAFVYEQYKLAFTPSLLTHLFETRVDAQMLTDGKYVQADSVNWWVLSGRNNYLQNGETVVDAANRFYLPVGVKDPFDNETMLTYDAYNLLIVQTEDAVHSKALVEMVDYRVLQPMKLKDINGNTSEVVTDELGMVIATSVYGNENDGTHGDQPLTAYTPVYPTSLDDAVTNPLTFLQQATSFFYYDLDAWVNRGQPACFASIARETHESELQQGQATKIFISVGYTGGLGQTLQAKTQAEPGIALKWEGSSVVQVDTGAQLRWVGNGRTVYNNKGNPVKQYEPFFSTAYVYEPEQQLVEIGFSSVLYYDAAGRNIRTEHADGSLQRIEFDAWKQLTFDGNDTVFESEWYTDRGSPVPAAPEPSDPGTRAAWLTARHANTPSEAHLDSLGRTIYSIANNGSSGNYTARIILDIENNQRILIDARDNPVMQYAYDMTGRKVYQDSMDSHDSRIFSDVLNKPVYTWDSRNHRFHTEYDALHRPLKEWLVEDITVNMYEKLVGFTVYGEGQPDDTTLNLRGKAFKSFDQSGLAETTAYDFKGNVKADFKQLSLEYKKTIDWNVPDPLTLLNGEKFPGSSKFNAVNRPTEVNLPDGSRVMPVYNEANALGELYVFLASQNSTVQFVRDIDYNANGQRERILYGNNIVTKYTYDEKTYRLTRLLTTRNMGADILQDLNYTYDPVGNITQTRDNARQTVFFNNAGVDPSCKFEYDAIYRLTRALGREHAGQNLAQDQFDRDKTQDGGRLLTLKGDMNAMQQYEELYQYDAVDNMLQMVHNAGSGIFQNKWTRIFTCNADNNQLARTQTGPDITSYSYDANGNMQNLLNGSFNISWNYTNRLQQIDLGGGGTAYYVYDGSGQRVRKIIENGGLVKERVYLGGYEVYRETQNGAPGLERQTLHIMDDKQRIALVEVRVQGTDSGLPFLIRYQFGNQLGTSCLEIDGNENDPVIITYEEYYPFGSTAYQATRNQTETAKRYRFTGKERDEESGLYYHGARYYAPWLARWTTTDPGGIADGTNIYIYSRCNPVKYNDPSGKQSKPNLDFLDWAPKKTDDASSPEEEEEQPERVGVTTLDPRPKPKEPTTGDKVLKWLVTPISKNTEETKQFNQEVTDATKAKAEKTGSVLDWLIYLGAQQENREIQGIPNTPLEYIAIGVQTGAHAYASTRGGKGAAAPKAAPAAEEPVAPAQPAVAEASIPPAPKGAVVRPGQVAASSEFTLAQKALRFVYKATGGKLSGAGPSNVTGMAIPFSDAHSTDPVLRSLQTSPPGNYIGPNGVVIGEMPSRLQFAQLARTHGTEFALVYDPIGAELRMYQGNAGTVSIGNGFLLAHTHPTPNILPGAYPWAPSQADVNLLKARGQTSSVIVITNGEGFTFEP